MSTMAPVESGSRQLGWKQIRLTQVRQRIRVAEYACTMLRTGCWLRETRLAASLHTNWKGSLGIESDRPADYCGVPGGDHAVRTAISQAAAHDARLLSRGPQYSLVGDFALDCRGRDQHANHHQYSRPRVRFESYFSASGDGIHDRSRHYQFCAAAAVFSRRVVHGLSAD